MNIKYHVFYSSFVFTILFICFYVSGSKIKLFRKTIFSFFVYVSVTLYSPMTPLNYRLMIPRFTRSVTLPQRAKSRTFFFIVLLKKPRERSIEYQTHILHILSSRHGKLLSYPPYIIFFVVQALSLVTILKPFNYRPHQTFCSHKVRFITKKPFHDSQFYFISNRTVFRVFGFTVHTYSNIGKYAEKCMNAPKSFGSILYFPQQMYLSHGDDRRQSRRNIQCDTPVL